MMCLRSPVEKAFGGGIAQTRPALTIPPKYPQAIIAKNEFRPPANCGESLGRVDKEDSQIA
jgi:hypothetical protein